MSRLGLSGENVGDETEKSRRLILAILEERITPENRPLLFDPDDDVLFRSLVSLQLHDREWLQRQLDDERYSLAARRLLRDQLPSD